MRSRAWSRRAVLAAALAAAEAARAQGAAPRRVGVLAPSTAEREAVTLKPFFNEMARLGWAEGRTVVYDRAFANDQQADLGRLAIELAARRPEVIFAPPQVAAVAARQATASIPIVFATGTDPVGAGLAASLARPGGNVSGMISVFESLAPKQFELMRLLLPAAQRIGFVGGDLDPRYTIDRDALARHLSPGATLRALPAGDLAGLEAAARLLVRERVEVIFTATSLAFNGIDRLVEVTRPARVALIAHRGSMVDRDALARHLSPGATLRALPAGDLAGLEAAARLLVRERVEVLFTATSLAFNGIDRLVEVTRPARVALIAHRGSMVDRGALMAYGAVLSDQIARAALVVDKVLRGARIGEIPIEQPSRFEFVINRGVANAYGIALPQSVLLRADRVVD